MPPTSPQGPFLWMVAKKFHTCSISKTILMIHQVVRKISCTVTRLHHWSMVSFLYCYPVSWLLNYNFPKSINVFVTCAMQSLTTYKGRGFGLDGGSGWCICIMIGWSVTWSTGQWQFALHPELCKSNFLQYLLMQHVHNHLRWIFLTKCHIHFAKSSLC